MGHMPPGPRRGGCRIASMPSSSFPTPLSKTSIQSNGRAYTAVCFIDIPEGIPHVMRGMIVEFSVE
jgi:hypothetical protein